MLWRPTGRGLLEVTHLRAKCCCSRRIHRIFALGTMTRTPALRTVVLVGLCSSLALPQVKTKPGTLALNVLKSRCHDVSKAGDKQVFSEIDALAMDSTPASAEALAMLNGFY